MTTEQIEQQIDLFLDGKLPKNDAAIKNRDKVKKMLLELILKIYNKHNAYIDPEDAWIATFGE